MFRFEKVTNEQITRIECPGTEKHYKITRPAGFPNSAPANIRNGCERHSVMIEAFLPLLEEIRNFEVLEDDVWVITFPKCGTTWTQEMVWLLNNNLNFERAKKISLEERFPFLELTGALTLIGGDSVGHVRSQPRPRHIKSHLPAMLLPDQVWTVKPKIVYVSRNTKDAATSFYHHYRNIVGYDGSKEHFFDAFLSDNLIYAPFSGHVADYWQLRDEENMLFITYEQMKHDLRKVIEKVSSFLGKSYSEQEIEVLENHLSVESMRANDSCNMQTLVEWARNTNYSEERKNNESNKFRFIRSGDVGSYRNDMSPDFVHRFNEYEKCITNDCGWKLGL
ncbi:luciferin sulfotransferase-like [Toxorhynchites rutilus septentrionalis]|uniref:luciferin sulfotransferase-like n=1 Tax=Toxorhynchites rutilus septentrionalis TaxID=329112 RepID=UPI00247A9E46|nr:luciferin sulfotransferase-like [Toxorhynchites rutilus septentrionalis]